VISVIEIPTDINSSFALGAAKGPPIIKKQFDSEASNKFSENGFDLRKRYNWKNVKSLDHESRDNTFKLISKTIETELHKSRYCISIGGDHSITYPIIAAYHKFFPKINIVHFDAHPDLYETFDDNHYSHASPFARIMENNLATSLTQFGIRTMNDHQREQATRFNANVVPINKSPEDVELKFSEPVYISIDLDGLDPAYAPGVSHPEPGGLSTRDIINFISNIEGEIIGADIVEYNPYKDINEITAITAAKLLKELMGKIIE